MQMVEQNSCKKLSDCDQDLSYIRPVMQIIVNQTQCLSRLTPSWAACCRYWTITRAALRRWWGPNRHLNIKKPWRF